MSQTLLDMVKSISLRDSGRTGVRYHATNATAGATGVETLITLTKSSGTGATSTGTSFVIPSGKRFRITHISVASRGNDIATAQTTTFSFRVRATGGAIATNTTPVTLSLRTVTLANAGDWNRELVEIPEGYEIYGDGVLQFGVTANSVYVTNPPTWDVLIIGYEY